MQEIDFFRSRIDAMINLFDPLAVLATRLPWAQIEAAVAQKFEHHNRTGEVLKAQDMFGTTETLVGAGRSNAGRPKLPIRLMASLLYLKHSFNHAYPVASQAAVPSNNGDRKGGHRSGK